MKIIETTSVEVKSSRANYLNSLPEFQELFIELMLNDSHFYSLQVEYHEIGYVIVNSESVLIEFYIEDKYIPRSHEFFGQIIEELSITDVYCKSFDDLLLSSCLLSSLPYTILGVLYRDYFKASIAKDREIKMRKADQTFLELLLGQDNSIEELFETKQQLACFIQNEHVFEFYKNDEFVGCGMVLRTNIDYDYCDLGVWVNPLNRGMSIGSQIILSLREFAIKNKLKPSCGCAIDNTASQKTIEKSGFVSKHKMIRFKTK